MLRILTQSHLPFFSLFFFTTRLVLASKYLAKELVHHTTKGCDSWWFLRCSERRYDFWQRIWVTEKKGLCRPSRVCSARGEGGIETTATSVDVDFEDETKAAVKAMKAASFSARD